MTPAKHAAELLNQNAESYARSLLPDGRLEGGQWVCGDITGIRGNSLRLTLQGPHTGRWKDFATGESGDLLDLIVISHNLPISSAIHQVLNDHGVGQTNLTAEERDLLLKRQNENWIRTIANRLDHESTVVMCGLQQMHSGEPLNEVDCERLNLAADRISEIQSQLRSKV